MHRLPTAPRAAVLSAVVVVLAMPGPARAQEPPASSSAICQAPTHPGPFARAPFGTDRFAMGSDMNAVNAAMRAADEEWGRAFHAMLACYRKGDVLTLTHDAQANALRLCDWDKPVHFPPAGGAICTYAGGVRQTR